jgi:hypothetical protein
VTKQRGWCSRCGGPLWRPTWVGSGDGCQVCWLVALTRRAASEPRSYLDGDGDAVLDEWRGHEDEANAWEFADRDAYERSAAGDARVRSSRCHIEGWTSQMDDVMRRVGHTAHEWEETRARICRHGGVDEVTMLLCAGRTTCPGCSVADGETMKPDCWLSAATETTSAAEITRRRGFAMPLHPR